MRPSQLLLLGIVRALVGAHPRWKGSEPSAAQRIYFANHSSHLDALALWSALPHAARKHTRAAAANDYWGKNAFKRYIATRCLNAVLIDRQRESRTADPIETLKALLRQGDSLIIFPEGTRNPSALPGPFKSGLYRLAQDFPQIELVPVYLENLYRSMPKGFHIPLPLVCSVRFGPALTLLPDEPKENFLERARQAVMALS